MVDGLARDRLPGASLPQTCILVPGLDGTALLFYRQVPLLAERFDVVAFPLPESESAGQTMDDLVADLLGLIEQVASGPVLLCGESFGGALSLSLALAHPEVVAGLVILNSFPRVRDQMKLRLAPRLLGAVPWAAMPLVRRFTEHRLHSPHAMREDLLEFRERSKSIGRDGYLQRLRILRDYDVRDRLGEISAPALFLAGDRDQLVPSVEEAHFMAERVARGDVKVLEGYGHICLINHDLDLLEVVSPWLERSFRVLEPTRDRARE